MPPVVLPPGGGPVPTGLIPQAHEAALSLVDGVGSMVVGGGLALTQTVVSSGLRALFGGSP